MPWPLRQGNDGDLDLGAANLKTTGTVDGADVSQLKGTVEGLSALEGEDVSTLMERIGAVEDGKAGKSGSLTPGKIPIIDSEGNLVDGPVTDSGGTLTFDRDVTVTEGKTIGGKDPGKIVVIGDDVIGPGALLTLDEDGKAVAADLDPTKVAQFGDTLPDAGDSLIFSIGGRIVPAPSPPAPLSLLGQFNDPISYVREAEAAAGDTLAERVIGIVPAGPSGHMVFGIPIVVFSASVAGSASDYATITLRLRATHDSPTYDLGDTVGTATVSTSTPGTYAQWGRQLAGSGFDIGDEPLAALPGFAITLEVTKAGDGVQLPSFAVAVPWIPSTDLAAPTVASTDPADEDTGVSVDANAVVYFSEPMDGGSLNVDTVKLLDPDDDVVTATITPASDGLSVTIAPDDPLANETTYRIRVTGATDASGNPLAEYAQATGFTTEAAPIVPYIVSVTPAAGATGVDPGVHPTVVFNVAMDPARIAGANATSLEFYGDAEGGYDVAGTWSLSEDGLTATFTPDDPLPSDTYHVYSAGGTVPTQPQSLASVNLDQTGHDDASPSGEYDQEPGFTVGS